uniref:Ig-like domain-containing protein n=1 Tax=Lates calcarifer TaxID=8187 RepID=A0A4W6BR84_LATCA
MWLNNEFEYYGAFNGRTTLDPATGELVVKNVAVADAGLYTVEINSNVQSQKYQVEVMKKVPKPTVLFRPLTCSQTSASCSLTCDGETKDAGTVTYSWKEDDREWKQGEKDKTIENNEEIKKVKIFSCQMKNTISEPHDNLVICHAFYLALISVAVVAVVTVATECYLRRFVCCHFVLFIQKHIHYIHTE